MCMYKYSVVHPLLIPAHLPAVCVCTCSTIKFISSDIYIASRHLRMFPHSSNKTQVCLSLFFVLLLLLLWCDSIENITEQVNVVAYRFGGRGHAIWLVEFCMAVYVTRSVRLNAERPMLILFGIDIKTASI